MAITRMNTALQECLNQCRGSGAPLARLARYCEELRKADWDDEDIRGVETAVVRLLSAMSDSDLPMDQD
jgi:hypothetical protein